MTNRGTSPASKNDSWSAYTHVEAAGRAFEIRHPWTEGTSAKSSFSIFRWNDTTGHKYWGSSETLEGAIEMLRQEEKAKREVAEMIADAECAEYERLGDRGYGR